MAKLPLEYHPAAQFEADQAFDWYRDRSCSTAERFLLQIEKAQVDIQDAPLAWAEYLHGTRRYKLKRFPYIVVYRVTAEHIEVIAVAHGKRKPGYWSERLRSNT